MPKSRASRHLKAAEHKKQRAYRTANSDNSPFRSVRCVNCGESMNIKKVWKHKGYTVCKKCYDNPYRMLSDEENRRINAYGK